MIDRTPPVKFAIKRARKITARDVYLAWLSCPADDAVDALANMALDLVELGNAKDEVIHASLAVTHDLTTTLDHLRRDQRG